MIDYEISKTRRIEFKTYDNVGNRIITDLFGSYVVYKIVTGWKSGSTNVVARKDFDRWWERVKPKEINDEDFLDEWPIWVLVIQGILLFSLGLIIAALIANYLGYR